MTLVLEDVHSYYGLAHVLQGINLTVDDGEIVALLGRNGAGKSTTLKTIMGVVPPRRGRIAFDGQDLVRMPTHLIVRRGIGWVPEERRIFSQLSVHDNLRLSLLAHKLEHPAQALEGILDMFPRLRERATLSARNLSGGEQQMLALGRALISRPKLLLIDEPTQGLAPNLVASIAGSLLKIKAQGLAVLLVEQNARVGLEIADRAYLIDHGVIQFTGTAEEVRANEAIQRQFLSV